MRGQESVYVFMSSCRQFFKIGISKNPRRRLADFEATTPLKLHPVIIAKIPPGPETARQIEFSLLEKYKDKQIRGEWFRLTMIDVREIRQYLGIDAAPSKRSQRELRIYEAQVNKYHRHPLTKEQAEKAALVRSILGGAA